MSRTKLRGPDLTSAEDVARIRELARYPLLDAVDVAWLFGVSRSVIFDEARRGNIAHRSFGERLRIIAAPIFSEIFPDGLPPALSAVEETPAKERDILAVNQR